MFAGGAIAGLCQALIQGFSWDEAWDKSFWLGNLTGTDLWALLPFAGLAFFLFSIARQNKNKKAA